MSRIRFQCPKCACDMEISLDSEASMVVLSCSECRTPLMYFSGQVFEVDSLEVGDLKQRHLQAIRGYMKIHKGLGAGSDSGVEDSSTGTSALLPSKAEPAHHTPGEPVRDVPLASEDIIDLRIDLETCQSVEEFLKRIG